MYVAAAAGFAIYSLVARGIHPIGISFLILVVIYPLLLLGYIWRFAASPENKMIYEKRRYELSNDFIACRLGDGSESKLRYDHITKVIKSRKYYLLYLSKTQHIYIPVDAFLSVDDVDIFETFLRSQNLL